MSTSTFFPTSEAARAARQWWIVDASEAPLGRVASAAARILTGKEKPIWTPHVDTGDFVVIVNSDQLTLTGRKGKQKLYRRHSGYPGGLKETTAEEMIEKDSTRVVELAVRRMLPKTRLGRAMAKKLKVYQGSEHPHAAQAPQRFGLEGVGGRRESN